MGVISFFNSAARLMRTIAKPDWRTYWLSAKICLFGVLLLGGIGYIIRLLSVALQGTAAAA